MLRSLRPHLLAALAVAVAACSDGAADSTDASVDAVADGAADAGADAATDVATSDPCTRSPARCTAFGDDAPPRLSEHGAAYDETGARMLIFGGTTGVPDNCDPSVAAHYVADTWSYDDACAAWTRVEGNGPPFRGRHAMAGGSGAAWVHGGRARAAGTVSGPYTMYDDLWRFDFASDAWSEVAIEGPAPSARVNHVLVWDSNADRLLLFGGSSSTGMDIAPLADVWAFDPSSSSWTQLPDGAVGPTPRLGATGVFDATRNQLVVFGGFDSFDFGGGVAYFRDIWAYDLGTNSWTQLQNAIGAPEGRFGSVMTYDPDADVYVVFAGHDDQQLGNRNDAWLFDPSSRIWARMAVGDEPNASQIGLCEFPPDFTTVDHSLPERRAYSSLVWSQTCGHALLFGGKTDCGAANDVWSYADEAWTERFAASSGEVCLRFRDNPDNCANLCF